MANDTPTGDETTGVPASRWSRVNWAFIVVFTVLTVVGVAVSTGVLGMGWVTGQQPSASSVQVPAYVYLYASLGGLGYVFTKLMAEFEDFDDWDDLENLVEMGLRIPAAWVLAAGLHLIVTASPGGRPSVRLAAGIAFLVGLYVNVALKSLGSLADRILGRSAK